MIKIYRKYLAKWLPQTLLSALILWAGIRLLHVDIGGSWQEYVLNIFLGKQNVDATKIPSLVVGLGLITMSLGTLLQSRTAWATALFLLFMAALSVTLTHSHSRFYLYYCILLIIALLVFYRFFDKSSLLASVIFTFTSVMMLVIYATFGNMYLGDEFDPPITDLVTALYYSMVTMSTVGYGDISPQTPQAKMFTVSVIVMGLTVFATSITSLVTPLMNTNLKKAIEKKGRKMKRKEHFVVIGNTSLALNTCNELQARGNHVTRILTRAMKTDDQEDDFDVVYGMTNRLDVLSEAGVEKAKAVLCMLRDDSENTFSVLAARELVGHSVKIIVAVNDPENTRRVKLAHPDILISPQTFGATLAAMLLSDEEVTAEFVMENLFKKCDNSRKQ